MDTLTSPVATFGLLQSLGQMSPRSALARAGRRSALPGSPSSEWSKGAGIDLAGERIEWVAGEVPCAVDVLLDAGPGRGTPVAYCFMATRFAHPSTALQMTLSAGVPLLHAMTKDALWSTRAQPLDALVVVALELSGDFAQFALGDGLEDLGAEQFRMGLNAYRRAERAGWPGWAEAGVQVLEFPTP